VKKTPLSISTSYGKGFAVAWTLGILVSLSGCGSQTETKTESKTDTTKEQKADGTQTTDASKVTEAGKTDASKTEATKTDASKTDASKTADATTPNAADSTKTASKDAAGQGKDAAAQGKDAAKTEDAAKTSTTAKAGDTAKVDPSKDTPMAPKVAVDDLPQISAASKKVKLDTMPDKMTICTVNGTPITVSDYKHEFKMREAQTQALLSASPQLEKQLLDDAKKHNITLSSDEKHRLLVTAHKATSATGNVLKSYMKENNLTPEAFDQKVLDIGLALKDGAFQTQQTLLNELVDQQLFIARAKASGYTTRAFNKYMEIKRTPQYKRYLQESGFTADDAQTQLINRQLIMMAIEDLKKTAPAPTPEELQQVYTLNKDKLVHGDRIRLSQIVIAAPDKDMPGAPSVRTQVQKQNPTLSPTELDAKVKATEEAQKAKAQSLLARALKPGADFAKLANTESDDPGVKKTKNGGDIGFKDTENGLVKAFANKVKSLKPGQVYPELLKTQFGYHIIKCVSRQGKGPIPLSEVEPEISQGLKQQNEFRAVVNFLTNQHKSAQIKLSPEFQTLIAQDSNADGKTTK
jgi:parvulin-like peptidyl-prolyl isomerase